MTIKSVKFAVLTSGVDRAISDMAKLSASKDKVAGDATVRINLADADLTETKLKVISDEIKALTDKGTTVRVNMSGSTGDLAKVTQESNMLAASGARVSTTLQDEGEKAEKAGSRIKSGLGNILGNLGFSPLLLGITGVGAALAFSVKEGEDAQSAQAGLVNAIKDAGGKFSTYKGSIDDTENSMAKFGFTGSTVDTALTALIHSTGSVSESESVMGTAANLAAARHIDLASATSMLAKAAGGAMKGLKDLGITQVTGASQAKAMGAAETTLTDQINSAGGMAAFAAAHHLSLANATNLVKQAMGGASAASSELAGHGFTLSSVTTKITEAMGGDSNAVKELAKGGLTLAQAQKLAAEAGSGSVKAYNELGIVVLPKTATAAQRLAEIQTVLNSKLGGAAAAQAATFGGQIAALKAQFTDFGEKVGLKVLPALTNVLGFLVRGITAFTALPGPAKTALGALLGFAVLALTFTKITSAVTAAFSAITDTNPILLAITGIILISVLLITHWKQVSAYFDKFRHDTAAIFDGVLHDITSIWNTIYAFMRKWGQDFLVLFGPVGFIAAVVLNIIRYHNQIKTFMANIWDVIWNNTVARVQRGIQDVINWIKGMGGRISTAVGNLGNLLYNAGKNVIQGFFNGLMWLWNNGPYKWLKSLAGIISKIKGPISLDQQLLVAHGKAIMGGFLAGLTHGWGNVAGFLGSVTGKIGSALSSLFGGGSSSNVASWLTTALTLAGKPLSWLSALEVLVGKESGGNASAMNSIGVAGQHATGLMQTLPSTFSMFAMPGLGNILNPVDNAVAGIRYIAAQYGTPFAIPGLLGGNYVGYDQGGLLMPGFHLVANLTGKPEQVIPAGGISRPDQASNTYNITVNATPLARPVDIGREVVGAIREFEKRSGTGWRS